MATTVNSTYTYVSSRCLAKGYGADWETVDLSNTAVNTLYEDYLKVYLEVTNSVLTDPLWVDMDTLKSVYVNYEDTVTALLVAIGNATLETVSEPPSSRLLRCRFSDAYQAGFIPQLCKVGYNYPAGYPTSELPDVALTRDTGTTVIEKMHTHCLISVNGYLHRTDYADETLYIYDAGVTGRTGGGNVIGITSLADIGELTKVSFKRENLFTTSNTDGLKDKVTFKIDEDMTGKTFMMSLGGYLITPQDNVFYQSSDNTFNLDLMKIPYLQRLFESRSRIDLSSLNLEQYYDIDGTFLTNDVYSDDVIFAYFLLSQSFFIIVDCNHLLFNFKEVTYQTFPGTFTFSSEPLYPLFVAHGRLAEYWKVEEDNTWVLTVADSFLRKYVVEEAPIAKDQVITDHMRSFTPYLLSRGLMLEITGYND